MSRIRRTMAQVGWMLGIWCLGVVALGAAAYAMRLLMHLAGMTP